MKVDKEPVTSESTQILTELLASVDKKVPGLTSAETVITEGKQVKINPVQRMFRSISNLGRKAS